MADIQNKIVALAKRRGFIFPSSEIYGGLRNVYDYGPLGAELLKNVRNLWWTHFVYKKRNVVGIESQILMHPSVWRASGHVESFHEPLMDCKSCKNRHRADHLISEKYPDIDVDAYDNEGLYKLIQEHKIHCPDCGNFDWTEIRNFNVMFKTALGATSGEENSLYLRPETAQGMYVDFKQVFNSTRQKIPFGIAQIGKAFRNEITKGKFIFRTLEFEQMELQYFIDETTWKEEFELWRLEIEKWYTQVLGIDAKKFRWKPHHPDKLAHYAKKAEDYEYEFDWGFGEVSGLHYRTDFDLTTHQKHSGAKLDVDGKIPHVIESTYGLNRQILMLLHDAYVEEEDRVVLKLAKDVAPVRVAVFPLVKNKMELVDKAETVYKIFSEAGISVDWDDRGNIGKRYLAQDEIGTPYCVTVDYDTLDDNTVTVRDRDTKEQERVSIDELLSYIAG